VDDNEAPEQDDSSTLFENPSKKLGKPQQVLAAERWATQWRDRLLEPRKPRIGRSCLRAYALWHHEGLSVEDIADILRDPPLQKSTVTNYILESIRVEKLPYNEARVKEVLKHMPDSIVKTRYRGIKVSAE
jgi:exonuclease 3'-5' domain-containing protein 2